MNDDYTGSFIKVIGIYIIFIVGVRLVNSAINMILTKQYLKKYNVKQTAVNWKNASKVFGMRIRKLKKMSKEEIKKLYRQKVMGVHPDKGGNSEDFNNLHEAYKFVYASV